MENTKNKIPEKTQRFLNNLEKYLNTKFVYYGSVQRDDYLPNQSDIDIAIFTDNEYSMISRMKTYLHVKQSRFRKFVWKLHSGSKRTVYGYKLKYHDNINNILLEFTIYNNKFKDDLIYEYKRKIQLPLIYRILLNIVKFLFYTTHLISSSWYVYLKRKILSLSVGTDDDNFIMIPL